MKFSLTKGGPKDLKLVYKAVQQKLEVYYKQEEVICFQTTKEMSEGKLIKLPTGDDLFVQMRGDYPYLKLNDKVLPGSVFDPNYLEDKKSPRRKVVLALLLLQIIAPLLMLFGLVPSTFSSDILQKLVVLSSVIFASVIYFWVVKKGWSFIPNLLAIGLYSYYIFTFDVILGRDYIDFLLSKIYLEVLPLFVIWSMSSYWAIDAPPESLYDKD